MSEHQEYLAHVRDYSDQELEGIANAVDRVKFPERYAAVVEELRMRGWVEESEIADEDRDQFIWDEPGRVRRFLRKMKFWRRKKAGMEGVAV